MRPEPSPLLGSVVTKYQRVDSETDKRKCEYIKGKSDLLLDVPSIDEDYATDGLELVGT